MNKTCLDCSKDFSISDLEIDFLDKISPKIGKEIFKIPESDYCPGCRERQRLSFRNEWNLYKRNCDATGKDIIAIYSKESPYQVYDQAYWWSDDYDPLGYGRDFDFSKTFFEQFNELNLDVPKLAIQNAKSENSLYTNYSWENKNCFMAVGSGMSEDCYHCYRVTSSKSIIDCYDLRACELCYECSQSTNLNNCSFSSNCHSCHNLIFCENCWNSNNCIGCTNLKNEEYCIFNKKVSKEEFKDFHNNLKFKELQNQFVELKKESPPPRHYNLNSENCSGDQIQGSQDSFHCFTIKNSQDCLYLGTGENDIDCVDTNFANDNELQYFSTNLVSNYRILFSALVWYTNNSIYLTNCYHSSNLFGCTGMKKDSYCILNKKYSESDYNNLTKKVINHMKETGEWGKYLPTSISHFPYNKSTAYEYYPISKEEALKKNYKWEDDVGKSLQKNENSKLFTCSVSGKQFRIMNEELNLYEKLNIPAPDKCPEARHNQRMRNIKRAISNFNS